MKVIIAENDVEMSDMIQSYLSSCGYDAMIAESSERLFALLDEGADAVLLDIGLDEEQEADITVVQSGRKLPPTIIFSAWNEARLQLAVQRVGAVAFLAKPCSLEEVEEGLRKIKTGGLSELPECDRKEEGREPPSRTRTVRPTLGD